MKPKHKNLFVKGGRVYLDYAATTPVDRRVFAAMRPYFSEKFGNPGSVHGMGQEAITAVDEAREKIARAIGAQFGEVIFTGSATEANNLALRGVASNARQFSLGIAVKPLLRRLPAASRFDAEPSRRNSESFHSKIAEHFYPRVIISGIEHESILETAKDLSTRGGSAYGGEKDGVEVVYLPVNREGLVDIKKLKSALNERTVLVSVMYANNEVGTIQPIEEISKIIKSFRNELRIVNNKSGIVHKKLGVTDITRQSSSIIHSSSFILPLFHTDAVQALQYLNCDAQSLGVDFMTLSAHKIYGPKGIGALYVRRENNELGIMNNESRRGKSKTIIHNSSFILPAITGGGQEYNLRSGTENVPAIVGFGKAVELLKEYPNEASRVRELRDYFWEKLKKMKPGIKINGPTITSDMRHATSNIGIKRLPNNLNIYFPGNSAEKLLTKLDMLGIEVSAGSACSARSLTTSYVVKALGWGEARAKASLRFSLGRGTTKLELDEVFGRLKGNL